MADFDDDEVTPPPLFMGEEAAKDPRAKEWANRELYYVTRIASLQAEVGRLQIETGRLRSEKAKITIEVNRLRRLVR